MLSNCIVSVSTDSMSSKAYAKLLQKLGPSKSEETPSGSLASKYAYLLKKGRDAQLGKHSDDEEAENSEAELEGDEEEEVEEDDMELQDEDGDLLMGDEDFDEDEDNMLEGGESHGLKRGRGEMEADDEDEDIDNEHDAELEVHDEDIEVLRTEEKMEKQRKAAKVESPLGGASASASATTQLSSLVWSYEDHFGQTVEGEELKKLIASSPDLQKTANVGPKSQLLPALAATTAAAARGKLADIKALIKGGKQETPTVPRTFEAVPLVAQPSDEKNEANVVVKPKKPLPTLVPDVIEVGHGITCYTDRKALGLTQLPQQMYPITGTPAALPNSSSPPSLTGVTSCLSSLETLGVRPRLAQYYRESSVLHKPSVKSPPLHYPIPLQVTHHINTSTSTTATTTITNPSQAQEGVPGTYPHPLQRLAAPLIHDYVDLYYCSRQPFNREDVVSGIVNGKDGKLLKKGGNKEDKALVTRRVVEEGGQIDLNMLTDVWLVHVISHVLRSKDRVAFNSQKIAKRERDRLEKLAASNLPGAEDAQRTLRRLDLMKSNRETTSFSSGAAPKKKMKAMDLSGGLTAAEETKMMSAKEKHREYMLLKKRAKKQEKEGIQDTGLFKGDAEGRKSLLDGTQEKGKEGVKEEEEKGNGSDDEEVDDGDRRDQGFTKPKVLIVLPMKCHGHAVVRRLIELVTARMQKKVYNEAKFERNLGDPDQEYTPNPDKPADYRALFHGNNDDCFHVGVSLSSSSIKLCSKLYESDIIIGSPLGLKMLTGNEGDSVNERDFDFLSSIEIAILSHAEVFCMQNFEHLTDVFTVLNRVPIKQRGADFSRIKNWYLDGLARFYRQTVMLSLYPTPQLNHFYNKYCRNRRGRLRLRPALYPGVISLIRRTPRPLISSALGAASASSSDASSLRHVFMRLDGLGSPEVAADNRFDKFITEVWPRIKEANQAGHTLIYVPTYFDFVRLRNYFQKRYVNYCACCEFTQPADISRARNDFFKGDVHFMLLTERFHFYRRARIRGAYNVVWYGLPTVPTTYAEILSALERDSVKASTTASLVLYAPTEAMQLERIVGTEMGATMLASPQTMHVIT